VYWNRFHVVVTAQLNPAASAPIRKPTFAVPLTVRIQTLMVYADEVVPTLLLETRENTPPVLSKTIWFTVAPFAGLVALTVVTTGADPPELSFVHTAFAKSSL
jgi:hypothetical protein